MEEKIKNFDRKIEQMMNETAVAPPFGMWNRISAGLDAEVLPIAAAAPATLMPKRAIVGFVAGALILGGSLLTAYLMNNKTVTQPEVVNVIIPEVIIPEVRNTEPKLLVVKEAKPVAMLATKKIAVSEPVVVAIVKEEVPVVMNYRNVSEIAVPNQTLTQHATASADPYYFPPVDVNNSIATKTATTAKAVDDDDQPEVAEKKTKTVSFPSREKKLRPKKKRSSTFNYGRINRYKEPK